MQLAKLITLSLQKRSWQVLPVSVALSNTVKHISQASNFCKFCE